MIDVKYCKHINEPMFTGNYEPMCNNMKRASINKKSGEVNLMVFKKVMTTTLALALVGGTLIGCSSKGSDSATSTPQASGTATTAPADTKAPTDTAGLKELKMNYRADPPALDVSIAESAASFTFLGAISEGLYRLDKDLKPVPGLATDMPVISADGLTYTIKLRDANWSDGTPVKAGDFVYSFRRTLDPATKATYAFMLAWIKGGDAIMNAKTPEAVETAKKALGATAPDDKTLIITLERPIAFFTSQLAFLNFYPQKEEFVKAQGEKSGADADKVLGAGPFLLTKWSHDQTLVLEKNPKYWDVANVKLDKVTINIVKDTATGLNLYETNAVDYTDIKGDQIKAYDGKPDLKIKSELVTGYLNFQETKVPAFKNVKVRQAMNMAVDRQGIVDVVLVNGSVPATGYVPNGTVDGNNQDYRKVATDLEAAYDPAKAKTLLAEGLKEAGVTALPKLTVVGDDTETGKKLLEFLVSQWKANLGVVVDTEPMPHKNRLERELKGDYTIVSTLWGADYNDPMTFLDMYLTGASFNTQNWSNAKYDELIKAAQKNTDPAARSKQMIDAEKILMDEAAVFPLYFRSSPFVVKPKVEGLVLPSFGPDFELKWTTIK
jgi:oligopeptide transport system substrate-binding protein